MLKKLLTISIFLQLVLFPIDVETAYGNELQPNTSLVINEVELNAHPGEQESAWIELFNSGDVPFDLSGLSLISMDSANMTQHIALEDAQIPTIPPRSYHVIAFSKDLVDVQLTSFLLYQDQVLLDRVDGLNDGLSDDRTWQRYPDGQDSDNFEDWTFIPSTKARHNGNLGKAIAECYLNPICMSLDTPIHREKRINVNGTSFAVSTLSTSSIVSIDVSQEDKKLVIRLSESVKENVRLGFMHITFPHRLLSGDLSVIVDRAESSFFRITDDAQSRVIVEYEPGENRIIEIVGTSVIPEIDVGLMTASGVTLSLAFIAAMRRYRYR